MPGLIQTGEFQLSQPELISLPYLYLISSQVMGFVQDWLWVHIGIQITHGMEQQQQGQRILLKLNRIYRCTPRGTDRFRQLGIRDGALA